jgi:hypothetical protein
LFELLLSIRLYRNWRAYGQLYEEDAKVPTAMFVRISVFTIFAGLAIVVSVAFAFESTKPLPNICLALMPVAALVTFTQMVCSVDTRVSRAASK